jgi:hypothetical protein
MKALRAEGAYCVKIHGSEYMQAGTPDIQGCYRGMFFAFETKNPESRKNTSLVQERQMQKIRDAGGLAQVVCTVDEAVTAMTSSWYRRGWEEKFPKIFEPGSEE